MKKRISNEKLYANEILDDIECYKKVLDGTLKQFPKGFWERPWSYKSAKSITQYMLKTVYDNDLEKIKKVRKVKLFQDNKLLGMVMQVYNNNVWEALDAALNTKDKIAVYCWELNATPNGYWDDKKHIKIAIKWAVEKKAPKDFDIKKDFNNKYLKKLGLGKLLNDYSLYTLLNLAYPKKYKPWELYKSPKNYWDNKDNVKTAIKWAIEEKAPEEFNIGTDFNSQFLNSIGLGQLVSQYSLYELINIAYPDKYKPWELTSLGRGYWSNKPIVKSIVKWAVEEKAPEGFNIKKDFNYEYLCSLGLRSYSSYYSIYELIDLTYPNTYKPWEINKAPKGFWEKDSNIIDAIKWSVEEKAPKGFNVERDFTIKYLYLVGLNNLTKKFAVNYLIELAYPKKYRLDKSNKGVYTSFKDVLEVLKEIYNSKYTDKKVFVKDVSNSLLQQLGYSDRIYGRPDSELKALAEIVDW